MYTYHLSVYEVLKRNVDPSVAHAQSFKHCSSLDRTGHAHVSWCMGLN